MSELHPSFICSTAASPCKTCFHIFSMLLSLTQMSWSMQCAAVVVQKSITLRVMSMFSEAIFRRLSMNFYYAWHLLIIIISDVTRPVKLFHSPTTVRSPITECLMSDVNVGIWSLKWWSPPLKSIFVFFFGNPQNHITFPICLSSTFSSGFGAPRTSFSTFSMPVLTNSREGAAPFATRPPFLESLGAYLQFWQTQWICNVFGRISWEKTVEIHFLKS